MDKDTARNIDVLEDKLYAMHFAYMALAKALHQAGSLHVLHLVGALQDCADYLRSSSHQFPAGGPEDLSPVAEHVDSLRASVGSLQSVLEESDEDRHWAEGRAYPGA